MVYVLRGRYQLKKSTVDEQGRKNKMKKATFEELIARREQAQNDKLVTKEIEIKELDLCLTVRKIPLSRVLRMFDGADDNGVVARFELYKQLIYECVPLFQNEKLQQAYECVEPYDIVTKVLNDNITVIRYVGDEICGFYGLGDGSAVENLKN